jgi:hypothetical protein
MRKIGALAACQAAIAFLAIRARIVIRAPRNMAAEIPLG